MQGDILKASRTLISTVILTSASFAGYNIGSGFATGIESQQFFASWGAKTAFVGIIIAMIVSSIVLASIYLTGYELHFADNNKIYYCLFGKHLGVFFDWYIYISIILVILTMMSGAGATINQNFGLPEIIGTILMGIMCIIAALLDLKKVIRVLGYLGSFTVLFVLGCGIYIFIKSGISPEAGSINVQRYVSERKILQANIFGIKNPWMSAVASAGLLINSGMPWASATGALCKNRKEAILTGLFSGILYYSTQFIVVYINLVSMDFIVDSEIPILAAIQYFLPCLSLVYSCIIILAIFSTVSGRLFLVVSRFAHGNNKIRVLLTIAIVIIASTAGSFIPFRLISNIMFSISGAVGIIICILILSRSIINKRNHMTIAST